MSCEAPLSMAGVVVIVVSSCIAGLAWAIRNVRKVTAIQLDKGLDFELDDVNSMQS